MARRGTELLTRFTSDDREMNATHARQMRNAREYGDSWERSGNRAARGANKHKRALNGARAIGQALIAGAAAVGVKKIVDEYDRIGKLAERFDISTDSIQGLSHAAELAGADIEQVARAMSMANKAGRDAEREINGTAARAFRTLGIRAEEFNKLDQEKQFLRLADAIHFAADANAAMAAAQDILGESSGELQVLLEQGSVAITEQADSVTKATEAEIKAMEQFNDIIAETATSAKTLLIPQLEKLSKSLQGLTFLQDLLEGKSLEEATAALDDKKLGKATNVLLTEAERKAKREQREIEAETEQAEEEAAEKKATAKSRVRPAPAERPPDLSGSNRFDVPAFLATPARRDTSPTGLDGLEALQRKRSPANQFPGLDALEAMQGEKQAKVKVEEKQVKSLEEIARRFELFEQKILATL